MCGAIRLSNGPQYTAAMLFAIDQVNKKLASVSVPGVKFGESIVYCLFGNGHQYYFLSCYSLVMETNINF